MAVEKARIPYLYIATLRKLIFDRKGLFGLVDRISNSQRTNLRLCLKYCFRGVLLPRSFIWDTLIFCCLRESNTCFSTISHGAICEKLN